MRALSTATHIDWKLFTASREVHALIWRPHTKESRLKCVNTSVFSDGWTSIGVWSETESFLQMSSSQAWLHSRLAMHTATDKIKHSRLLFALKRPGPRSMWSRFFFLSSTSNDRDLRNHTKKYSNAVSRRATLPPLMKCDCFERRQRQTGT